MMEKRKWFRSPEFGRFELTLMRFFFALVLIDAVDFTESGPSEQGQPEPVGLGHWINFSIFSDPDAWFAAKAALAVSLVFYIWGRFVAPALVVATVVVIGYGTLKNSQGAITHHLQVTALVLMVQTLWYLGRAVAGRFQIDPDSSRTRQQTHRLAAWFAMQTVVATYVVTALTKLIATGGEWINRSKHFPLQLEKTEKSEFYNTLQPPGEPAPADSAFGRVLASVDAWFVRLSDDLERLFIASPTICRVVLGSGLALELFAFLALASRGWAAGYGLVLILFHLTISRIMQLDFYFNIFVVFIFLVNVPYWLAGRRLGSR